MNEKNMLVSLLADTSRIEEKINGLLEVLPKGGLEYLLDLIPGLLDNIVLVDGSATVVAGSSLDIVYSFDFDAATYGQIMTASRTLKTFLTHSD